MKGVSPLISGVLLILIVIGVSAVVGPWIIQLSQESSEQSGSQVSQTLICQQTAYTFDSTYQNSGAYWNISGTNGTISAKIINTKIQNLYNFTYELTFSTPSGERIVTEPDINVTGASQRTKSNPLKPGQSLILEGDMTNVNETWSLIRIKVLNAVCPGASPYMDV